MEVQVVSYSIVSPLGVGTENNVKALLSGKSGITSHLKSDFGLEPFFGAIIDEAILDEKLSSFAGISDFTKLERMILISTQDALDQASSVDIKSKRTLIIFSTTKGNIDLVKDNGSLPKEAFLWHTAQKIGNYFGNPNPVLTVSNACISGTLAIILGKRMIQQGKYDHVVIIGADLFSKFVFSGFKAFQAVSTAPCKPFDANRTGITLGEASATLVLSKNGDSTPGIIVKGGATSNDANHISGPSRTGDGLYYAIEAAKKESFAGINFDIDYISAHGTGTSYNDEMESKAIAWAGLSNVPVNSLKGYYGHTLGAAGVLESIITIDSMANNSLFASIGFSEMGVSEPLNIITQNQFKSITTALKTASGFGSCNAALIFSKIKS